MSSLPSPQQRPFAAAARLPMRKPRGQAACLPIRWAVLTLCGAALALPAVAGGDGGGGGNASDGDVIRAGGAGAPGNLSTGAGGAGGNGAIGGNGGAGGAPGMVVNSAYENPAGTSILGQAGGEGADGPKPPLGTPGGAGGGGGGGGGDGLVVQAGASAINRGRLTGGQGGQGGNDARTGAFAEVPGGSGGGGAGLVAWGSATNFGVIQGGAGADNTDLVMAGGGGAGVVANGTTIVNEASGTIAGGVNGMQTSLTCLGTGTPGGAGAGGAAAGSAGATEFCTGYAGAGIRGANLNVVNKGQVAGAGRTFSTLQGPVVASLADAIQFDPGTNRLELHPGFSFTGMVRGALARTRKPARAAGP